MNKQEEAYEFYKQVKAKPLSAWEGATFVQ